MDKRFLPVGGGKGGIGKSVITSAIGSVLAQKGKKVVYFDADLGGANLHLFLGVRYPERSLSDFLSGNVNSIEDILLDTEIPNTKLVCGASDILGLANPKYAQKQKIIRSLEKIDADYILLDLGAGTSFHTIDFFGVAGKGIVVIDVEPTTIENAYGFLKTVILRKIQRLYSKEKPVQKLVARISNPHCEDKIGTVSELLRFIETESTDHGECIRLWLKEFSPRIVLNRVRQKQDIEVAGRFCEIIKKYLNIKPIYIGYIVEDASVGAALRNCKPLIQYKPENMAVECIRAVSLNLEQLERIQK